MYGCFITRTHTVMTASLLSSFSTLQDSHAFACFKGTSPPQNMSALCCCGCVTSSERFFTPLRADSALLPPSLPFLPLSLPCPLPPYPSYPLPPLTPSLLTPLPPLPPPSLPPLPPLPPPSLLLSLPCPPPLHSSRLSILLSMPTMLPFDNFMDTTVGYSGRGLHRCHVSAALRPRRCCS